MFALVHPAVTARSPSGLCSALTKLALTSAAGCLLATSAHATLMTATLTGTISPFYNGFDAYRNTVLSSINVSNGLAGMTATVSITYDTALMANLYPNTNTWSTLHSPGYPLFYGAVGENPLRSASFTVNGVTLAIDVSGPSERGRLLAQNFGNPGPDSYILNGGDERLTWCINDFQCVESVGIAAGSSVNLFDADGFDPQDVYTWTAGNGTVLTGNVRLFDTILCQPAGEGGLGGATGLCPVGRFDYSTTPNATHWVEFTVDGTRLSIAPTEPSTSVPVPGAGWLMATGLASLARRRRIPAITPL